MNSFRAVFFLTVLVLAGCNGQEIADLENIRAANDAERQKLTAIAINLDQYKAEADKATADMREISLWRSDGDAAARMTSFTKSLGTARASYVKDGEDWKITISGTGGAPAAIATLHKLGAPGLVLSRIEASPTTWSATLRTRNTPEPPDPAAGARRPLPPEGTFPSAESSKLRAEIAKQEQEIAELNRLVISTKHLERTVEMVAREREAAAKDPERLGRALKAIAPLFTGPAPLLSAGNVDVAPAAYAASGPPAAGVTGETFAARKPEGWTLVSFESGTIRLSWETPP